MPSVVLGNNTGDDYSGTSGQHMHEQTPDTVSTSRYDLSKYEANDHRAHLIKFTAIDSLPDSINVSAAAMFAVGQNHSDAISGYYASSFRMLRDWGDGDATSDAATWNEYRSVSNLAWSTAGAKGSGTDRGSSASAVSEDLTPAISVYTELMQDSAQLRADIEGFASGAVAHYGWVMERTDAQNDGRYRVYNDENTGADGGRPYMSLTYTEVSNARNALIARVYRHRVQ